MGACETESLDVPIREKGRQDLTPGHLLNKTNCKTVEQAMSVRKLTASLLTALALVGGATLAQAQHDGLADPHQFDPDFQWFEPVYDTDLSEMKPKERAPKGWFATYDRLNLHGSRPELDRIVGNGETKLDGGWGHRYEVGYMLPCDDHGWLFNWTNNDVGAWSFDNMTRQERLNRYIDPADGFPVISPPFGVAVRREEDNNTGYPFRFYDVVNETLNSMYYDHYELNKTWRMSAYHYGGILEPFVGVRWTRMTDTNGFMDYISSDEFPPLIGPNFTDAEQITTQGATTENELVGPQLGFRYFRAHNRYVFNGGFTAFCGGNFQCSKSLRFSTLTIYDGNAVGDNVIRIIEEKSDPIYTRNEEFYVGFDARAELGYQLTKMIQVRAGVQIIDIARGVWRGGDGTYTPGGDTDQDYLMVGGTFGINLNH